MIEHTTKTHVTFNAGILEYQAKCQCEWSSAVSLSPDFARRSASQHRRYANPRNKPREKFPTAKSTEKPKPPKPQDDRDKPFLKRLTAPQQARYRELLAGRTNVSGTGPMAIGDIVRREALETVLIESELDGACCAGCVEKRDRKNQPVTQAEPLPTIRELVMKPWEGRKLSTDELRERIRRLRARNPLKGENTDSGTALLIGREAETGPAEAGASTDVPQMVKSLIGQFCAIQGHSGECEY